jgi:hypothetical protein
MVRQARIAAALSIAVGASIVARAEAGAQQAASSTPAAAPGPAVNDIAPDFNLAGADRPWLAEDTDQTLGLSRPRRRARLLLSGADQRLNDQMERTVISTPHCSTTAAR